MRPLRIILALAVVLCAFAAAGCGGEPKVERVDVTWVSLDPPPRWGLFPGYRQEVQFRKGSAFQVDVYSGGKVVTGGTVGDTGYSLAFLPSAGARDIEAQPAGQNGLQLFASLKDEKGGAHRVLCLKVERLGDKIYFEVPK